MTRAGCCCKFSSSARLSIVSIPATFTACFHHYAVWLAHSAELPLAPNPPGAQTRRSPALQITAASSRLWVAIASIASTEGVAMSAQPAAMMRMRALARQLVDAGLLDEDKALALMDEAAEKGRKIGRAHV